MPNRWLLQPKPALYFSFLSLPNVSLSFCLTVYIVVLQGLCSCVD